MLSGVAWKSRLGPITSGRSKNRILAIACLSWSKSPKDIWPAVYSPRHGPVLPAIVDRPSLRSVSVYLGHPPKQPFLSTVIAEISVAGLEVCCWASARALTDKDQRSGIENLMPLILFRSRAKQFGWQVSGSPTYHSLTVRAAHARVGGDGSEWMARNLSVEVWKFSSSGCKRSCQPLVRVAASPLAVSEKVPQRTADRVS